MQLNKISQSLADLPDTATATLLVSPQDLANIDGGGVGTWVNSIQRIRDIKNYHGLDGMEILDGVEIFDDMGIYDAPVGMRIVATYEKALADQIKAAFARAQSSGQEVTTGLFMPTKQLVDGREIGSRDVSVDTNLYSKRKEIGKQGDEFITRHSATMLCESEQWAATEHSKSDVYYSNSDEYSNSDTSGLEFVAYSVDFTDGYTSWAPIVPARQSSRPVALQISPSL